MYSLKLAHLAKDMIGADVIEFYRDMRTFGKGLRKLLQKSHGKKMFPLSAMKRYPSTEDEEGLGGQNYRSITPEI